MVPFWSQNRLIPCLLTISHLSGGDLFITSLGQKDKRLAPKGGVEKPGSRVVHYRVLVGSFPYRGSQNLVSPAAGVFVRRPVFDDSYTLGALFGSPVPDRCRAEGSILVPVWSQFGPSLVPTARTNGGNCPNERRDGGNCPN